MKQLLTAGLTELKLDTSNIPVLEEYAQLMLEKNKVMNLTAITDPADVANLHLLDCAEVLHFADLKGKKVIDLGTGAGFPGMVLRILEPDCDIVLLDSLGKRMLWLEEVGSQLQLKRIKYVTARAEEYVSDHREKFDIATSRAVAQLNILCELALPYVKVGGNFLAMKSAESDDEINQSRPGIGQLGGKITKIYDYVIPGTEVTHRIVEITKVKPTPNTYPRAFARIKKKPL